MVLLFILQKSMKKVKYYHMNILPTNLQKFACTYFIYSLAKASNLKRWEIKSKIECQLCRENETQLYLFINYEAAFPRNEWWHDSIVKTVKSHFQFIQSSFARLYINTEGFENLPILFKTRQEANSEILHRAKPDIVI